MSVNILVVEDDTLFIEYLSDVLKEESWTPRVATTLAQATRELKKGDIDLVILDLNLPDGNGMSLFSSIERTESMPAVIVLTGSGSAENAECAILSGACDYMVKPPHSSLVKTVVKRTLKRRQESLSMGGMPEFDRSKIVGESPKIKVSLEVLAKASQCNCNLLLTGETGTGKELFARTVHTNSKLKNKNFVVVDCTSIPQNLSSSILFGHLKGSFTGASEDRDGLFKEADGGTLFLDEVGDLPLALQKSLLRVLQERKFRPVGAKHEVASKFRLIAATNKNLAKLVEEKRFRKDLYYRLKTLHINLPPLRERSDDIRLMVERFLPDVCTDIGVKSKSHSKDFLEYLLSYNWPGNVRELINALNTAVTNSLYEKMLYPESLPTDIRVQIAKGLAVESGIPRTEEKTEKNLLDVNQFMPCEDFPSYKELRERVKIVVDKKYLSKLIMLSNYNLEKASELSKLSRARLYQLFKKNKVYLSK